MYIVILVTTKNAREANKIAKKLVEKKLIACANIIKGVNSIFRWAGKVDQANEALMIIKSRRKHLNKIIKEVKSLHSYDCPEVIALPILGGNRDYLKWVEGST